MQIKLSDHFSYSRLLKFTFPAIIMMVFSSLYGIVDGVFISNYAGKTAFAAVNFVFPILNIISIFGFMLGAGGSAVVSKTLGEGDRERANRLFSLFVYASLAIGAVFSVFGFFLLRPILSMLGASGEMLDFAVLYGNVILITMPLWNLQFLFQMFFVTAEKPRLGLFVTLFAGISNMLLDFLLVGVFDLGIVGAAIASAMSQIVGGGLPLIYFAIKNTSLLRLGRATTDLAALARGAINGSSELVTGVSLSLVGIIYNYQLMRYAGENGVAAYGVIMYVGMIFIGIFLGYANGVAPIIGFNFGAKNTDELKTVFKKSTVIIGATSLFMFVLSEALVYPLSAIFTGYDGELFSLTLRGFIIYSVSFLFSGIAIFASSFFTALNNGLLSAVISFLRTLVFQILALLLIPLLFGIDGVFGAVIVSELLSAIVALIILFSMRKRYGY